MYAALYLFSDLLGKSRKKQSTDLKKIRCQYILNTNLSILAFEITEIILFR